MRLMQYSSWLRVKKPMCCPSISGNKSQREELDSILFIFEVSQTNFYFCETVPFSTNSCFNLFAAGLWSGTIVSIVPYSSSVYFLNFPRMDTRKKSLSQSISPIIFAVGPPVCFLFLHLESSCKSKVVCPATPVCAYIIVPMPLPLSLC